MTVLQYFLLQQDCDFKENTRLAIIELKLVEKFSY